MFYLGQINDDDDDDFIAFTLDICTRFTIIVCFVRAAISARGAWLSCSSRPDVCTASLLVVL